MVYSCNKETLLIYDIIWSILSSRFLTVPCYLCQIPSCLHRYLSSVFFFCVLLVTFVSRHRPCTSLRRLPQSAARVYCARCAVKKEREIRGRAGNEIVLCECARNYSGTQFIAPMPDPNPIPSLAPCPAGDWVDELHGSYVSTISRL